MSRHVTMATWDDAPHLSAEDKVDLWNSIPPYQREARSKGIPVLGAGVIYPVPEKLVRAPEQVIPEGWPRVFGMDVGWNWTAGVWLAQNPNSKELLLYNCYKAGHAEPAIHAAAFHARGAWVPGVIDPAAAGSNQKDGTQLLQDYRALGLNLHKASNTVDAGLLRCWQLLSTGQLKALESCLVWWDEFRNYRRDKEGRVVKENDHLMDAMRYAVVSGLRYLTVDPKLAPPPAVERFTFHESSQGQGWMG